MIDTIFTLRLALSFLVGSLWIVMTTTIGDRFGSKIGGFIGGIPSTAAVSLFFIGLTQSPHAAAEATTVFPLSYAFTGLFLVLYALAWRWGFLFAMSFALGVWFALSACVVVFGLENFPVSVAAYVVFFTLAVYLMEFRLRISSLGRKSLENTVSQILGRAVFGGLVVTLTVCLGKVGGPVFGGIFSAFPAVFISILFVSYRSRGMEFSRAMTKPLLITGMVSIFLYGVAVRVLYPLLGLWWGTLGSYSAAMLGAVISLFIILRRLA